MANFKISWKTSVEVFLQIVLQICFYSIIALGLFYKVMYFHEISGIYSIDDEKNFLDLAVSGSIFVLIAVIMIFSFSKTKWILVIADILISIVVFADVMYSKYYYNPLTLTVVFYQFKFLGDIKNSASALFNYYELLIFADIPLLIFACLYIKEPKGFKWWIPKMLIACIILNLGQTWFKEAYNNSEVLTYIWEKKNMARDLGVLYYHYDDLKSTVRKVSMASKKLTDDEIDEIEKYKYKKTKNKYTALDKGKNLIILQLEAFQGFVINATIEGQEVTPNLNKLAKENLYCDNLYFQANYGNTSDAEFIANTSLYPSKTGAVYYEYPSNTYYSVANILNQQNYYTAALHGFKADFWNRTEMYRSLGFQRYYSQDDFNAQTLIGFGISDDEFFEQSIDYLIQDSNGNPFYGFMVALTSHHPYDYFEESDFNVGKYEGTMLGDFLKGANYVDNCIGILIDYMKQKDIYDNTVLAIYGDHAALFSDEAENLCEYLNIEYNDINWSLIQKVPFILHSPSINESIQINVPTGQIDILPTIANLMDLDIPYMYGRDLLNNEYGYAVLPRSNIVTEKFIFMIDEHNFYDLKTMDKLEETDDIVTEARQYYYKKNVSDIILQKNALKKLEE